MSNTNVPQKYLKDSDGSKFSPIVSFDSVYDKNGYNLTNKQVLLYNQQVDIPSRNSGKSNTIYIDGVDDLISQFEWLIFIRGNGDCINKIYLKSSTGGVPQYL